MAEEFRFGVAGGFSGSRAGTRPDAVHEVDRDGFDALFERLSPRLSLGLGFCDELELESFEQLHPDHLVDRVPALAALLAAHGAAADPARVRAHLAEAGLGAAQVELEPPPDFSRSVQEAKPPPSGGTSAEQLLDEILGGLSRGYVKRARAADPELARILDEVASPHAERIDHAGIRARRAVVEAILAERLRSILHHPEFLRLEASWRSLRQLVRASETGEALRIFAIDLPIANAAALADLRRIVEESARADEGLHLLVLDREVEASEDGLAVLAAVGGIAAAGRLPCLLGAGRSLWDPASEKATAFLARARGLSGSDRVALCGPRLLTRLPYGKSGEPLERFAFEELTAEGAPALLWGNGAFALAQAALDSIAAAGTPAAAPRFALREGLPIHASGPGSPAGPTEMALPEAAVARLRDLGLTPLAGIRKRDALLVASFRSLTGTPLFAG